jgi:hypothetical protein
LTLLVPSFLWAKFLLFTLTYSARLCLYSPHRQPTLIVKYVAQIVTGEDDGRRYRQSPWASMREMTFAYQTIAINQCTWNDYIAYEIYTCSSAIFRGSKLQGVQVQTQHFIILLMSYQDCCVGTWKPL